LDEELSWESALALEPGRKSMLTEGQLDEACRAFADFTDIKSPYTLRHSSGVARLAEEAARKMGLPAADGETLRRAGLLHDIGRTGVSSGIWGKPGPLTGREWEQVRLHSYHTERVLARPQVLKQLGGVASYHHERLDGSGYHRGAPAVMQTTAARILAAADVYHAMTEERPHRPALTSEQARTELRKEARAGRLDGDAVSAVLEAAGHRVSKARQERAGGLSDREIEVLRLLVRGHTIKKMAEMLTVSQKTVDNHIQHIYNKISVSTRAGATLFAMEHNLVSGAEEER
jgi:HD-GYP domain-containing protein (c-di-GMP phosphodiesterase class II)